MIVYVGKSFTAAVAGRQIKEVTCETCGKHFFYELSRMGVGAASAPYMIGQSSAQERSKRNAAANLQKRLGRDEETVPCPKCHWINFSSIRSYRKSKQRGWTTLAIVTGFIGFIVSLVVFGMAHDVLGRDPLLTDPVHWKIAGVWIGLVVGCLLAQWLLRRRIDLNRTYNGKKRLPVGTPPAIVQTANDANGEPQYEVIPYDPSVIESSSKWAIFRAGQFSLAPLCCRCLGEPNATLRLPFVVQTQPMTVPLCTACRKAIRRNWWIANLLSLLAAAGIGWLLSLWPEKIDSTGRTILMVFAGGALAFIGFCAVDQLIRPYSLVNMDAARGVSKIRFRNRAYTALLIRRFGEMDGYFRNTPEAAPGATVT